MFRRQNAIVIVCLFFLHALGCAKVPESDVELFATVEEELALPILGAFERSTDDRVGVISRFASDADGLTKMLQPTTTGEPACDLVWNSGVIETVRLQQLGLLRPRSWATHAMRPVGMVATDGSWCGFAATARVLIINTQILDNPEDYPRSVLALADPKWHQRCAVATPTDGSAATHFAVLRQQLGRDKTLELLRFIHESAIVLPSSKHVAIAVSAGRTAWGVTDTDAAIAEVDLGHDVAIVFPDQAPSELGTLLIPNTVAVLNNAKHPISAELLADYLVLPQTEDRLAMGNTSQLPLSRGSKYPPRVLGKDAVRWMRVNFESVTTGYDEWIAELQKIFVEE